MASEALMSDSADVLKKCFLFQAIDDEGRRRLAERAHRRSHGSGEKIFAFGDPGHSMMAILTGTVRISRPTPNGKEIILGQIGPGELLGEIAILDGGQRSAEARAVTKCELLVLERRDVVPFLEANPKVCLKLLEVICGKLRRSDERMTDIGFAELSVRLAKTILYYSRAERAAGKKVRLSLTQTELADMIGGTRESVNRQLREWQKQGVLEIKEGWLCIENVEKLSAVAERS